MATSTATAIATDPALGNADDLKESDPRTARPRRRKYIVIGVVLASLIAVGLGVGLGVGLTRSSSSDGDGDGDGDGEDTRPGQATTTLIARVQNTSVSVDSDFWQPEAGTSWQIVLYGALTANGTDGGIPTNASIYDIDLFDSSDTIIRQLHDEDRRVICYFSAGSYENWRPDAGNFTRADYGRPLDGWQGEWWLNTNSSNVRQIMAARMDLAAAKGCDGVDPDNVDGYANDSGINLSTDDAIDYMTFLAIQAHQRNLSIGLKNADAILPRVIYMMQWSVNEQCSQYQECDKYRPFLALGKPVLHLEYPPGAPDVSMAEREQICQDGQADGFSTLMKEMELNWWAETCGG